MDAALWYVRRVFNSRAPDNLWRIRQSGSSDARTAVETASEVIDRVSPNAELDVAPEFIEELALVMQVTQDEARQAQHKSQLLASQEAMLTAAKARIAAARCQYLHDTLVARMQISEIKTSGRAP